MWAGALFVRGGGGETDTAGGGAMGRRNQRQYRRSPPTPFYIFVSRARAPSAPFSHRRVARTDGDIVTEARRERGGLGVRRAREQQRDADDGDGGAGHGWLLGCPGGLSLESARAAARARLSMRVKVAREGYGAIGANGCVWLGEADEAGG